MLERPLVRAAAALALLALLGAVALVVRAQGSHSFDAQANTSGLHTLYFDNSFSFGSSRDVTLRYGVR